MLKSVRLKNFKLHEDTLIEAAPITVFIGPNNSGKSSVFQAVLALRQASGAYRKEFLASSQRGTILVDVGDFHDVLRQGQSRLEIHVAGVVHSKAPLTYDPIDVSFGVRIQNNTLADHEGHLQWAHGDIDWAQHVHTPGSAVQPAAWINIRDVKVHFTALDTFRLLAATSYQPATAAPMSQDIVQLADLIAGSPSRLLDSLHFIPSLRGFEESGYPLPKEQANSVERLTLAERTGALASLLAYNRDLEDDLSRRLEEVLQIGIKVKLLPGPRVTIWAVPAARKAGDRLFVNEGTGANQLPFILVPIGLTAPNESVMLSEPEAHLHPKAQSELTSMLLRLVKKQNLQLFLETHSEHVLHKLLHAVATGELAVADLAFYYFENESGKAKVTRLKVDERGGVEGGLPGFFDQSLAELSEYLDALKKT